MSAPEPTAVPASVETRLAALEARIARLEQAPLAQPLPLPTPPLPGELLAPLPLQAPAAVSILGGLGRVFLILGGAFFLRALTDGGTLPHTLGVSVGLIYALAWLLPAWRTTRTGEAGFYTLASVLIAYPLLIEATTTFAVVPIPGTVVLLLVLFGAHLAVAWHRDLEPLAWLATLAALGTGFLLMARTHAITAFALYFLLLGTGLLWLTYGRRWRGLRWPTALAADATILVLTIVAAWPGGPPEAYRTLPATQALLLAMALPLLYLGSFAWRMLQQRRVINAFEGVQTALVLIIGFGGAVRIALASGSGAQALGCSALAAGLGCYGAAFPFVADQEEVRANFNFFTSLGLIFLLLGSPVLLPLPLYGLLAALLGLTATALGLRFRRTVLIMQGALCLGLATAASGLLLAALRAFLVPAQAIGALPGAAWVVLAALLTSAVLIELQRPVEGFPLRLRVVVFLVGTLSVLATAGAASILALQVGGAPLAKPAQLAFLRTLVLSAAAVALALHSRHCPGGVLRLLAYPILALAVLKFLLEDLPLGRPMMLFLAFMCLGAALILVPRLGKPRASETSPTSGKV